MVPDAQQRASAVDAERRVSEILRSNARHGPAVTYIARAVRPAWTRLARKRRSLLSVKEVECELTRRAWAPGRAWGASATRSLEGIRTGDEAARRRSVMTRTDGLCAQHQKRNGSGELHGLHFLSLSPPDTAGRRARQAGRSSRRVPCVVGSIPQRNLSHPGAGTDPNIAISAISGGTWRFRKRASCRGLPTRETMRRSTS